jgi:hypothetical protein
VIALAAALSIAISATARLDVPYVPQTPSLCGGAAAAMVFRYWGERHANVEPFAALVDERAGGIATDRLVSAIREQHWEATPFTGTMSALHDQLAAKHPVILLIEDRPRTYHYIVAIGLDASGIIVHDPAWGPSRHLAEDAFLHAWSAANFWSLVVLPTTATQLDQPAPAGPAPQQDTSPDARCQRLLDDAVADIGRRGLSVADDDLDGVKNACPGSAAPIAELAGVRFGEQRWRDAADLAEQATSKEPGDAYAWDVLGSSRFMLNDLHGALAAWNRIDKPRIDSISITGLKRTRYQLVAEALELQPDTLLTVERFRLAERRLEQLPDRSHSRIGFVPTADGYAVVDVAIAEEGALPHTVGGFASLAVNAAVNEEVTATIPGGGGEGELWSASWRWWENRPRVGLSFAAPRVGPVPGAWRVDASWEAQSFAVDPTATILRENRLHAGVTVTNWFSHAWRYELSVGADSWDSSRRAALLGATLERRGSQDRLMAAATVEHWLPIFASSSYSRALLVGAARTSNQPRGLVDAADIGFEVVTADAPLSLWPGAGDGHARAPLLRAHPLLVDGIVTGPVFGRHVQYANDELTYWIDRVKIAHLGLATFADAANASARMANAEGKPFQVDVGAGLRLQLPGGTLRADYARGLRDGEHAVTLGFDWFP